MTKKSIAETIKVSPSTITRELQRNSGSREKYNWQTAQANARLKKHRSPGNRTINPDIRKKALTLLTDKQWSPRQISGYLLLKSDKISHETIYKIIREDKKQGGLLYLNCRHKLKHRARPVGQERINIPNRISIDERPKEADGTRFGDFEMDTIVGKGNKGAIVPLVERSTNLIFMRKITHGKNARETALAVIHLLEPFKKFVKTITTDNGTEFTCHQLIARKLHTTVYFAHPHSPWQKGTIENMNGLIRQYIPKSTDFKCISHQKIKVIQDIINNRPRQKLKFATPQECFYENIS